MSKRKHDDLIPHTGTVMLADGFKVLKEEKYTRREARRIKIDTWKCDIKNLKPNNNFYIIISPKIKDK